MNGASIQDSGLVGAPGVMNTPMPSTLPPSLVSFMQDNGLPQEVYKGADEIERYVRANPRRPLGLRELEEALGHAPRPVPWLPELFSLPASVKVAASNAYKEGRLYGIDLSSAAAGTWM